MIKKIMNSVMPLALAVVMSVSWGEIFSSGNSLFLFGEPEHPNNRVGEGD